MSANNFITNADDALISSIWKCLEKSPQARSIISSQDQISLCSPKTAGKPGAKLSIYLYLVEISKDFTFGNTQNKSGFIPFVLHYLVTPLTDRDKDDHLLVETIMGAFLATSLLAEREEKTGTELMVRLDSLSQDDLCKLWTALGIPLKLSAGLAVSCDNGSIPISEKARNVVKSSCAVGEIPQLYESVLKTFNEQSSGWKSRPFMVKQWVFMDFKKTTGMTVEEMQIALNSLGDKLELGGSLSQFVKPLDLLTKYYQHQLEQLGDLRKISSRQRENIELIEGWIKDVQALAKALEK
jgi:Pvc16 N-terminal domain